MEGDLVLLDDEGVGKSLVPGDEGRRRSRISGCRGLPVDLRIEVSGGRGGWREM